MAREIWLFFVLMNVLSPQFVKNFFSNSYTNSALWAFLTIDFLFICIHFSVGVYIFFMDLNTWGDLTNLLVTTEGGYSEYFQYFKYLMIIGCIAYLIMYKKRYGHFLWLVLFTVFFFDDAFEFHERIGVFIAQTFDIQPIIGLRGRDFGELVYVTAVGTLFLIVGILSWKKSSTRFKYISLDITLLVGFFLFFGIGLDLAHAFSGENRYLGFLLGLLEDGGEMLALSLLGWYFLLLTQRTKTNEAYLFDML